MFLDFINSMQDVWIVTNWQALQWVRDPTPISRINNFQPFQCNYQVLTLLLIFPIVRLYFNLCMSTLVAVSMNVKRLLTQNMAAM